VVLAREAKSVCARISKLLDNELFFDSSRGNALPQVINKFMTCLFAFLDFQLVRSQKPRKSKSDRHEYKSVLFSLDFSLPFWL